MKVKRGLMVLMIGGLSMVLLAGCGDKRNSREWIENKFATELSRVYPTEKVEDLFQEFPDGFEIDQSYFVEDGVVSLTFVGDSKSKKIEGQLIYAHDRTKTILSEASIEYNQIVFSDQAKAEEYWPYEGFLFQQLTINQDYLSKQDLVKTEFITENGDFGIIYHLKDSTIENFLNLKANSGYQLDFGGSESNIGYYYSLTLHDPKFSEFSFSERISD